MRFGFEQYWLGPSSGMGVRCATTAVEIYGVGHGGSVVAQRSAMPRLSREREVEPVARISGQAATRDGGRWQKEQEFFDNEEYSEGPLAASTIERYTLCRKPYLPAEYPFWILGDVRGKRILEVGCGDGTNAVLLALKGATVVGVDISPRAIEIARERARLHGVADRASFFAMPLEVYLEGERGRFDVICGFAFLHHVIALLDDVLAQLRTVAHEGTAFVFAEPVTLWRALRRLRMALPVRVHGTPDERPLEPPELAIVQHALPNAMVSYFTFLLRAWHRFVGGRYEEYSGIRRTVYEMVARLDRAILSVPGLQLVAFTVVIHSMPEATRRASAA